MWPIVKLGLTLKPLGQILLSNSRNVRLALPLMGSTPLGTWSTWPALLLNYNLPPWLVTKRFFMILCLIIPGPQNMKMGNFDVYLAPALEELQDLWNGVKAMDVLAPPESREFTLKAMLIWTIHYFLG